MVGVFLSRVFWKVVCKKYIVEEILFASLIPGAGQKLLFLIVFFRSSIPYKLLGLLDNFSRHFRSIVSAPRGRKISQCHWVTIFLFIQKIPNFENLKVSAAFHFNWTIATNLRGFSLRFVYFPVFKIGEQQFPTENEMTTRKRNQNRLFANKAAV